MSRKGYVSGHYAMWMPTTWNSNDHFVSNWTYLGSTERGFDLIVRRHRENVADDEFGNARADRIRLGQEYDLRLESIEFTRIRPMFGVDGHEGNVMDDVGFRSSDLAMPLVLTPTVGTPAAKLIGAGHSRVFWLTEISDESLELLSSHLSKGPLTFAVLPFDGSGSDDQPAPPSWPYSGASAWDIIPTPDFTSNATLNWPPAGIIDPSVLFGSVITRT